MDVATVVHRVEARSPLLDTAVTEYGARTPVNLRLPGYTTRYLLNRLAERYVPHEVLHQHKRGFVMPAAAWLRPEFVTRMLSEHKPGHLSCGDGLEALR